MKPKRQRLPRLLFLAGLCLLSGLTGLLVNAQQASAYSSYLTAAENQYPNIKGTKLDSCQLCHPAGGYSLNPYAQDYKNAGHSFTAIEQLDSDGDKFNNITEINAIRFPGDASDFPSSAATNTPTATRTNTPPAATATSTWTPTATSPGPSATPTATSIPATATATATDAVPPTATNTPPAGTTPTRIPVMAPPNRFAFLGEVSDFPGSGAYEGSWTVGGRIVQVGPATWLEQPGLLGEHSQVWVLGRRAGGGAVDATYIRVLTQGEDDEHPAVTPTPSATVAASRTPKPTETKRPTATFTPTKTPRPNATATRTPTPSRTPKPTEDDDRRPQGTPAGGK